VANCSHLHGAGFFRFSSLLWSWHQPEVRNRAGAVQKGRDGACISQ
jgi:hypothetical protein